MKKMNLTEAQSTLIKGKDLCKLGGLRERILPIRKNEIPSG